VDGPGLTNRKIPLMQRFDNRPNRPIARLFYRPGEIQETIGSPSILIVANGRKARLIGVRARVDISQQLSELFALVIERIELRGQIGNQRFVESMSVVAGGIPGAGI
jgi:hypothetical protein